MAFIDKTIPKRVFDVSTVRDKQYLGDDVRVNARDAQHAKQIVEESGYEVNKHFEPKEVKKL